jgi:S-DNA-T family DNA segregation ATPase FtsK/SpoIIIE
MEPTPDPKKEKLAKEIKGILLGAAGVFILVTLVSFNAGDRSFNSYSSETVIRNLGGRFGAQLSDLLLQLVGLAAYLLPATLLFLAYLLLRFKEIRWKGYKFAAYGVLLVTLAALLAFFSEFAQLFGQTVPTGGAIGYNTARFLKASLGSFGAMLLLLPLLAASIMVLSRFSFILFAGWWFGSLRDRWHTYLQKRALNRELANQGAGKPTPAAAPQIKITPPPAPGPMALLKKEKKRDEEKAKPVQEAFDFLRGDGIYSTPPLSLLDTPPTTLRKVDKDVLTMNARLLEKKLLDFGIAGEVTEIAPGPVVTMYEFAPGPGIKVSRIAGLADDLSMALQALAVRIVAPIPGKGVVGIELPNRDRETVFLKEIFTCDAFHKGKQKLPLALGKDIAGDPLVTDLAKMPHLLVAGATGAGKSVSINTMILSLLYTATPRDVRLIMVDPKMLELSIYEGIPHLLLPVVTNPKKASLALHWAVEEMGRRYRLMADKGVRNIDSYNKQLALEEQEALNAPPPPPPEPEEELDDLLDEE